MRRRAGGAAFEGILEGTFEANDGDGVEAIVDTVDVGVAIIGPAVETGLENRG